MAVCARFDVSGFQLFRKRRYSKKKIAGRLGAEAAPCTDRAQETTLSHPQSGDLPATLEVRRAQARRPQRGDPRRALCRSRAAKLRGPSDGTSGDTALSHVLLRVWAVTRWRTGSNLSAGPYQGNQRRHLGNLCPLKAECSNSAKERRLRRRARGVLAQRRAQS